MSKKVFYNEIVADIKALVAEKAGKFTEDAFHRTMIFEDYRIEFIKPKEETEQSRSFSGNLHFEERKERTFGDVVGSFFTGGEGDYVICRMDTDNVVDTYGISYAPNASRSGVIYIDVIVKVTSTRCQKNIKRLYSYKSKISNFLSGRQFNLYALSISPKLVELIDEDTLTVLIPCKGKTIYEMVGKVTITKRTASSKVTFELREMQDGVWEDVYPEDYAESLQLEQMMDWLCGVVE